MLSVTFPRLLSPHRLPSFLPLFFSTDLHPARLDNLVAEYEDLWQHTQAQDGLLKGSAERLGELAAR